jgi:hypothetical protein
MLFARGFLVCGVALLLSGWAMAGHPAEPQGISPGQRVAEGLHGPLPKKVSSESPPRAFFLEPAPLRVNPSGSTDVVSTMEIGSSLEFIGEGTDDFGREWSVVAYPWKLERHEQVFLAPFNEWEYSQVSGTTAVLVAPASMSSNAASAPGVAASAPTAPGSPSRWWTDVVALGPEYDLEFGDLVGVSARFVPLDAAEEAIEILGGMQELGSWPSEPIPGQLHVPDLLPLLFRWNGTTWRLLRPVQYLGASFGLLGNPSLALDRTGPQAPGGFDVPCWRLIGAMDPRGVIAGTVEAAPAVKAPEEEAASWKPNSRTGLRNLTSVILPTVTAATATPPRVFRSTPPVGVALRDDARRHAVYLQQDLGPEIVSKLHGRELTLDVWARTPPAATASAAIGIDVEVGGERFSSGGTVNETSTLVSVTFTVPEGAEWLTVRLLPLDTSLAVEQAGAAIFEQAVLRLSTWPRTLDPSVIPLHTVTISSYQPIRTYARTPVAVSTRPLSEIEQIWDRVMSSDWAMEDKQLVVAGRVRAGMTAEQVGLSWGEPSVTALAGEIPGLDLRWDYEDRSAAFAGGELVSWTVRVPPPEEEEVKLCPCTEIAPETDPPTQPPDGGIGTGR